MNTRTSAISLSTKILFIFTAGYLALAAPVAISHHNHEFMLYIGVTVFIATVVSIVHIRIKLSTGLLLGLSIWGLLHMAGGLLDIPADWPIEGQHHVLYNLWLIPNRFKFDQAVHTYGFGMITWLFWQCLRNEVAKMRGLRREDIRPTIGLLSPVIAAGMGFGALNEMIEFLATLSLPDTNVGGYENTGWDLVYNTVGALLSAAFILMRYYSARNK